MRAEVPVDALSEEWNDFVFLTSGEMTNKVLP